MAIAGVFDNVAPLQRQYSWDLDSPSLGVKALRASEKFLTQAVINELQSNMDSRGAVCDALQDCVCVSGKMCAATLEKEFEDLLRDRETLHIALRMQVRLACAGVFALQTFRAVRGYRCPEFSATSSEHKAPDLRRQASVRSVACRVVWRRIGCCNVVRQLSGGPEWNVGP